MAEQHIAAEIKEEALCNAQKFKQLLFLFSECHNTYSKSTSMSDEGIQIFSKFLLILILSMHATR